MALNTVNSSGALSVAPDISHRSFLPFGQNLASQEPPHGLLHLSHLSLRQDVGNVDVSIALERGDLLLGDDVDVALDARRGGGRGRRRR